MKKRMTLLPAILLLLMVSACSAQPPVPSPEGGAPDKAPGEAPDESPGCQPGQAADYFPYQVGTQATYAGFGNEYASFTLNVLHQSGSKIEWRRDTGGTVMGEVFDVQPQQVTRIYREGEVYDTNPRLNNPSNQSEPILKGPIQVGTQWTSGDNTFTIQDTNATVQAMNQSLTCVLLVEVQNPSSLIRNYYHQQYGLVLVVFDPAGTPVESRLATFTQ